MGKKNFSSTHYLPAKRALGGRPTVKISYFSDNYKPQGKFAGVIMYHWRGQFQWQNEHLNWDGRAFYVAILDTSKWPQNAFRRAGQGMVHDYIFKQTFGEQFQHNTASVGGFAVVDGQPRFSSMWLNTNQYCRYSDGDKYLSEQEQALVGFAVREWMKHGTHHVASIPDWLDQKLSSGP